MIKVTDYIANRLVEHGVRDLFMITGGGAMHLNDSFGKHPDLNCVFHHHEQACAIAAEGYARISGKIGVVNITTGPGGLNTLTGVMGQWTDSIPVLYISGQIKYETCIDSCKEIKLRQLGDQEVDIISIVKPITKYAVMIKNPSEVKYHIDKAIYIATHGRPGPVWLDIPLNVQGALIDETTLKNYDNNEDKIEISPDILKQQVTEIIELLNKAERPVIIAGHGIRIAKSQTLFLEILKDLQIPVLSTFNGLDLIASDHPCYIGRIGTIGDRAANFALQNADLVIFIGTRNNIRQASYNWKDFAKNAKKVIVDIDHAELQKPTVVPDIAVNSDAKVFLELLKDNISLIKKSYPAWIEWCKIRQKKYPIVLQKFYDDLQGVNPYIFIDKLTKTLTSKDIVVAGNGSACVIAFQTAFINEDQRMFWNSGCASMGYDLPASIGASVATNKKQNIICLTGDGSMQMNIQELQTIFHHQFPIKMFYLNNDGYVSTKQTQDNFFEGRRYGCDAKSGISFPDIIKIAKAYGIKSYKITKHNEINKKITTILVSNEPVLCEVVLNPNQRFEPKLSSEKLPDGRLISKPLEDMFPFLDREEFMENMIVK